MKTLILSMLIALNIHAAETKIAVVTSSESRNFSNLILEDDDGQIKGLQIQAFNQSGKLEDIEEYDIREINSSGASLHEEDGIEVVSISNFSQRSSSMANVDLHYLTSGVTGAKRTLNLKLAKTSGSWSIIDSRTSRPASRIHFKAKKILGRAVGISSVTLSN
jgi:hypothetical protein